MPTDTTDNLPTIVTSRVPLNAAGLELANLAAWHLLRIANTGILAGAPPANTQPIGTPANPAATRRAPWLEEPPGAVPFLEQGQASLPLGTLNSDTVVLKMQCPQGSDGVIKWISNNAQNAQPPLVSGDLIWKININGRLVRNFGAILQENGTIYQGREISPIRIFSGDIVTYTVQQVSTGPSAGATTGLSVCSISGYFYPSRGVS